MVPMVAAAAAVAGSGRSSSSSGGSGRRRRSHRLRSSSSSSSRSRSWRSPEEKQQQQSQEEEQEFPLTVTAHPQSHTVQSALWRTFCSAPQLHSYIRLTEPSVESAMLNRWSAGTFFLAVCLVSCCLKSI